MHRRSVVVSTLGITQTLAWGSTYYLAAVFADPISDTLQLPHVWFFGIFSASLLLSGLLGPLAGRMIDEHGGRDGTAPRRPYPCGATTEVNITTYEAALRFRLCSPRVI